jgi:hypothetical protein
MDQREALGPAETLRLRIDWNRAAKRPGVTEEASVTRMGHGRGHARQRPSRPAEETATMMRFLRDSCAVGRARACRRTRRALAGGLPSEAARHTLRLGIFCRTRPTPPATPPGIPELCPSQCVFFSMSESVWPPPDLSTRSCTRHHSRYPSRWSIGP